MGKNNDLREALTALDWGRTEALLDEGKFEEDVVHHLAMCIRQASSLVLCYPNDKRAAQRAAYFQSLQRYVSDHLSTKVAGLIEEQVMLIQWIERGYHRIVEDLTRSNYSQHSPAIQIAAALASAEKMYQYLGHLQEEGIRNASEEGVVLQGPMITAANGRPLDADDALASISGFLANTIGMIAHKYKLYQQDGALELPALPIAESHHLKDADEVAHLAYLWRLWRRTETRIRFLDAPLTKFAQEKFPEGLPDGVETVCGVGFTELEAYDYMGNERLKDRLVQNYLEMSARHKVGHKITHMQRRTSLPPTHFVDGEEAFGVVALASTLCLDIGNDQSVYGGIRLVEWVRGYAVLRRLASNALHVESDDATYLLSFSREELLRRLKRAGFTNIRANLFIDHVALCKDSYDLFDYPLMSCADSQFLLFTPTCAVLNVASVVLSRLAALGEELSFKGPAFEDEVHRILEEAGREPKKFRFTVDGEEFEYDAVVPWDDYIFLFECKNQSLSRNYPEQVYWFQKKCDSHVRQVKRLAKALGDHPAVVREVAGIECVGNTIVPCILNAQPYARVGHWDGVFFTDSSSLGRFFADRDFRVVVQHSSDKEGKIQHRTTFHRQWADDAPTPEDLLRHLDEPFQVRLMWEHLGPQRRDFVLSKQEAVVVVELARLGMSVDSIAAVSGVSGEVIRQEIDRVASAVQLARDRNKAKPND